MADNVVKATLNQKQKAQVDSLLGDPTQFPQIFKNWVSSWTQADTTTTLASIEGWASYQSGQAALDASQDSAINTNAGNISNISGDLVAAESAITGLQNSDASQNSTLAGHTSLISGLQSSDGSQNIRLAALESVTVPGLLETDTSPATVAGSAAQTTLTTLSALAGVLPAPSICEFHASGIWQSTSGHKCPAFALDFSAAPILSTGSFAGTSSATSLPWEVNARTVVIPGGTQLHSTELKIRGLETGSSDLVLQQTTSLFTGQAATAFALTSNRAYTLKVTNGDALGTSSTSCLVATLALLAA